MTTTEPPRPNLTIRRETMDPDPPAGRMSFCLATDLTGNGRPDVLIGALGVNRWVDVPGPGVSINLRELPIARSLVARAETNVFWYENPGWERHDVARAPRLAVGGAVGDLTGDGRPDLVAGQDLDTDLSWFEPPADPREPWPSRLITDDFERYHDVAVADVDDDGEREVVFLSQESAVVGYYDVPDDPRQEPWPREHRHILAENLSVTGVAVADLDGDGRTELVAGPNVFRRIGSRWERERVVEGWDWTRVVAADVDGDGERELVISEGDLPSHEDRPARLGVFDPPDWMETRLRDDLFCPHSLQVADFDGDGHPDIYVAEMGLEGNDDPRHYVFRNRGDGRFDQRLVDRGRATHEATAVDLDGSGRPDIVGKAHSNDHVDVWYNETEWD